MTSMKKTLTLLPLLALLSLGARASACDNPPCSATIACPEGETCSTDEAAPIPRDPPEVLPEVAPEVVPEVVPLVPQAPKPSTVMGPVQNAQVSKEPPVPLIPEVPSAPNPYRRHFGFQLDAGIPDAFALGLVVRPIKYGRVEVAGTYNDLAKGIRGGVTVLPIFGRVLSATLEGGKYFDGNANKFTSKREPVLDSIGYEYANFHLGLDFGRERMTFFVHGGMSYLSADVKNLNQQFSGQVQFGSDPKLTAWFPSLKLGLIVYTF